MKDTSGTTSHARHVLTIESTVPYSQAIGGWLAMSAVALDAFVKQSRRYEQAYLAWEVVRRVRNPIFVDGTGFEGYYVGQRHRPMIVFRELVQIGRDMLENNYRLYRFNHRFRSQLLKTLLGEIEDRRAISVWAAQFGAALGRLRCRLHENLEAHHFRSETYHSVLALPEIHYHRASHGISQRYALSTIPFKGAAGWKAGFECLHSADADAGYVIASIGKFGHPLVRTYLDYAPVLYGF